MRQRHSEFTGWRNLERVNHGGHGNRVDGGSSTTRDSGLFRLSGGIQRGSSAETRATVAALRSLARWARPGAVDHIYHLSQPADILAVKLKDQPRQFGQMRIVRLEGQRGRADDLSRFDNVAKLGVQP